MFPSYDFDIHCLIPRDVVADPAIGKLLGEVGFESASPGISIALFRDPTVVAMIERADPVLRDFLKASGFGFTGSQRGTPAGYYPGDDGAARDDVIARVAANLDRFDMKGADLGGFDVVAFLKAIIEARPLPVEDAPDDRAAAAPAPAPATESPEFAPAFRTHGLQVLAGPPQVLPLMVLSLGLAFGLYLVIQKIGTAPVAF